MTTLVVGDVHGCADELARLLDRVQPTRTVLVGDLYTKGPDPVGVWQLVRDRGLEAVRGNHDARLEAALAGDRPNDRHARAVVDALDAEDAAWRDHLSSLPLFRQDVAGFTVVHAGLHPSGDLDATTPAMAVNMRRFPMRTSGAAPWAEQYVGDTPVAYGHDAKRGLVWRTRAGRPHVVGLDTGCVYGGSLTGFVPAEARLVTIPAARVYRAID